MKSGPTNAGPPILPLTLAIQVLIFLAAARLLIGAAFLATLLLSTATWLTLILLARLLALVALIALVLRLSFVGVLL